MHQQGVLQVLQAANAASNASIDVQHASAAASASHYNSQIDVAAAGVQSSAPAAAAELPQHASYRGAGGALERSVFAASQQFGQGQFLALLKLATASAGEEERKSAAQLVIAHLRMAGEASHQDSRVGAVVHRIQYVM